MNVGDLHRETTVGLTRPPLAPLWTIGLSALLIVLGLVPRRSHGTPSAEGERGQAEEGQGQSGRMPLRPPARGWRDILLRVYKGISEDRIFANAAAVTFYALLALFPAIAALVSIYGLFADPSTIPGSLDAVSGILPGAAIDVIRDQLTRLAAHGNASLGISFGVGLAISLWSANGGVKALFEALNAAYEEKEKRSLIELYAISLGFTIAMILFLLVAVVCVIAVPVMLNYVPGVTGLVVGITRWPLLLVLVAVALAFVYRYGPSRTEPRWRWVSWGSAVAAVVWLPASALFSWYASNFGNFDKTYGSLGAVVGFMMWMWLSIIVILVGARLNAETERQVARESASGA
ncbi:MAG: YihY/virulence factor BrkB family protein [Alphaproteobacteria bacterium]|nr:YihY/virulence factor BrkB family protein [Alphaproteobacteria bacterium]